MGGSQSHNRGEEYITDLLWQEEYNTLLDEWTGFMHVCCFTVICLNEGLCECEKYKALRSKVHVGRGQITFSCFNHSLCQARDSEGLCLVIYLRCVLGRNMQ